jgi:hypothetical protein
MAAVGGMFAFVAVGQAVAIRWKNPRAASVIAGTVYWLIWAVIIFPAMNDIDRSLDGCALISAVIFGPVTGYLVGVLVGGVFLVAYHLRGRSGFFGRRAGPDVAEVESPWEEK